MYVKSSHLFVKCFFRGVSLDWLFPCSFKTVFRLAYALRQMVLVMQRVPSYIAASYLLLSDYTLIIWGPYPYFAFIVYSFIIYILQLEQRLYKSRYLVGLVHCCMSKHLEQCLTYSRHSSKCLLDELKNKFPYK